MPPASTSPKSNGLSIINSTNSRRQTTSKNSARSSISSEKSPTSKSAKARSSSKISISPSSWVPYSTPKNNTATKSTSPPIAHISPTSSAHGSRPSMSPRSSRRVSRADISASAYRSIRRDSSITYSDAALSSPAPSSTKSDNEISAYSPTCSWAGYDKTNPSSKRLSLALKNSPNSYKSASPTKTTTPLGAAQNPPPTSKPSSTPHKRSTRKTTPMSPQGSNSNPIEIAPIIHTPPPPPNTPSIQTTPSD